MVRRGVKYRELIRRLRRIAAEQGHALTFLREGSNHELWEVAGERLSEGPSLVGVALALRNPIRPHRPDMG